MRVSCTATMPVAKEMQHIIFKNSAGIRMQTYHDSRPTAVTNKAYQSCS